jgi:quercetin dioxygenase-like cupin family protein
LKHSGTLEPSDEGNGIPSAQPHLGAQLRGIRMQQGLSIADVAKATDISVSFLSLVEKGNSDISIGRLMRLTSFYGVGLADVLPHSDGVNPEVLRSGEHRVLPSEDEHMEVTLLTNDGTRVMRPILVRYEPGGGTSEYVRQEGDVFVYVLTGEITIDIGSGEPIVLHAGDTAYLQSGTPRKYENRGSETAAYIGVLAQEPGSPRLTSSERELVRAPKP